ncbi:MAG TPA: PLDc N-terminal domain-containing protein [Thermoanaerobaculia bacterium]
MFFGLSLVLFIAGSIFWIWMLIVAATKERSTQDKLLWVIIIIFTHIIGAAI